MSMMELLGCRECWLKPVQALSSDLTNAEKIRTSVRVEGDKLQFLRIIGCMAHSPGLSTLYLELLSVEVRKCPQSKVTAVVVLAIDLAKNLEVVPCML
jgi:hypothetical protein